MRIHGIKFFSRDLLYSPHAGGSTYTTVLEELSGTARFGYVPVGGTIEKVFGGEEMASIYPYENGSYFDILPQDLGFECCRNEHRENQSFGPPLHHLTRVRIHQFATRHKCTGSRERKRYNEPEVMIVSGSITPSDLMEARRISDLRDVQHGNSIRAISRSNDI